MDALERVQRRFTRILPGQGGLGYEGRLEKDRLFSLQKGRLRGDVMEVSTIMRGINMVDSQRLFSRVEWSTTRGHRMKVRGAKFRGGVWGSFSHRRCLECTANGGGGGSWHVTNVQHASL